MIKEIRTTDEVLESVQVIRESFATVAEEWGLTRQNSPTHNAFITEEVLFRTWEKGIIFFGLYEEGKQVGFVAVEKSSHPGIYYLEKLAVLPELRHAGYGKQLMNHVFEYVKEKGGEKISIGIINHHTALKEWYLRYGFKETGRKTFDHLPFEVCYLEKAV